MAFLSTLDSLLDFIEESIKHTVRSLLMNYRQDLSVMAKFNSRTDLISGLERVLNIPFHRVTYTAAIEILEKESDWEHPVQWGYDLHSEHEKYLAEKHFKGPVFVIEYPSSLKPFYMRRLAGGVCSCVDLLVPGIGELGIDS